MSEPVALIEITNLPSDFDRKTCRALFSEYGKVQKLYVNPEGTFAKVYFDTIENAYEARNELHGKPPLNLYILEPTTKDYKFGSKPIADSSTSSFNDSVVTSSSNMNMQGYYGNYNDVQGSVSHDYVDIFGRVVTTLEADDGEKYISLDELKKSGFELFEAGTLPKRGQHPIFDEKLVSQFEVYMKMKAAKFMSRNKLKISEDDVNHVIDREKNEYLNVRQGRVVQRDQQKYGLLTVTTPVNTSPSQASGSFRSGNQSYSRARDKSFSRDDDRSGAARRKSFPATRTNENNQQKMNNSLRDDTSNVHKPPMRRPYTGSTYNEFNSHGTPPRKTGFNQESSHIEPKPLTRTSLTMNNNQKVTVVHIENELFAWVQLSSNVSTVEEILLQTVEESTKAKPIKPVTNKICAALFCNIWFRAVILSTRPLKVQYLDYGNENNEVLTEVRELSDKLAAIPGQAIRICLEFGSDVKLEPHMDLSIYPVLQEDDGTYIVRAETPKSALKQTSPKANPPSNSSNLEASVSSESKPQKQPIAETVNNITPKTVSFQRKVVIEDICDNGIFELADVINDTTFVGFTMPMTYNEEIFLLEGINDECKLDPLFKPKLGELVAAKNKEEIYVRAMIINNSNAKYACALIDYGYVVETEDVRPLPERFKDIPEFAFLCVTDANVLQDLKAEKSDNMSVQIKSPSVLTVKAESGREFVLRGSHWDAFATSPLANKMKVEETQAVFKERPPSRQLKSDDAVLIVAEQDGRLLVRTKECNSLLKEVNQELRSYIGEPFKQQPEVGYLAVCPYNDDNLYRVIVISVNNTHAMVDYIDYGNSDKVLLKELKNINKKLATMDSTLIKIALKGFTQTKFTSKAVDVLADCSMRKEKFVVVATNEDNVYELLLLADKSSLSEKLASVDKPTTTEPVQTPAPVTIKKTTETVQTPAPVTIKKTTETVQTPAPVTIKKTTETVPKQTSSAIKWTEVPVASFDKGMHNVMCMFTGNVAEGTVTFTLATNEAALAMGELTDKIVKYMENNTDPYCPQQLEVCLAKFEDEWYRAAVIQADSNKYGLYYIDYGNSHTVTANEIRKIPREIADIKCNTAFCQLDGVLKDNEEKVKEPLRSALKERIVEYQTYDINVINQVDGSYTITIPALYESLKKEGLL